MDRPAAQQTHGCQADAHDLCIPFVGARQSRGEQTVQRLRPRTADGVWRSCAKSARRVVPSGEGYDDATRRHGAGLSWTTVEMRRMPSPSVRAVEPAGLLQLCRVLFTGWSQSWI